MNPLFGPNRLKLGVFGANLGGGCTATEAEGTLEASWPATRTVAQLADAAGIEAMVPVALEGLRRSDRLQRPLL